MILLGIVVGMFIPQWGDMAWLRVLIKLAILPLIMGVGYEFIMLAGKHNNVVTRVLSAPGLWMQRLTTREPSKEQLEVALTALMYSMPDEFPDFDREYYKKENVDARNAKKSEKESEKSENDTKDEK